MIYVCMYICKYDNRLVEYIFILKLSCDICERFILLFFFSLRLLVYIIYIFFSNAHNTHIYIKKLTINTHFEAIPLLIEK